MSAESRRFTAGQGPGYCQKCEDACLGRVALIFAPGAEWKTGADGLRHWVPPGGCDVVTACGWRLDRCEGERPRPRGAA